MMERQYKVKVETKLALAVIVVATSREEAMQLCAEHAERVVRKNMREEARLKPWEFVGVEAYELETPRVPHA